MRRQRIRGNTIVRRRPGQQFREGIQLGGRGILNLKVAVQERQKMSSRIVSGEGASDRTSIAPRIDVSSAIDDVVVRYVRKALRLMVLMRQSNSCIYERV
jgi:hypothetical protein